MMKKDIFELGLGVAIGLILYKVIKLAWSIVTFPAQLALGHTDWDK